MDGRTVTLAEVRDWPATVGVRRACEAIGISGSHGYKLARDNQFPCRVIHAGGRIRVITASLVALLEGADGDGEQR